MRWLRATLAITLMLSVASIVVTQAPTQAGAAIPPTITFQVQLAGARKIASDQFTTSIKTGGINGTSQASATSTGAGSTIAGGIAGPFAATAATTYTLAEIGAGAPAAILPTYTGKITCTDANGVQTGLPTALAYNPVVGFNLTPVAGAAITCTVTDTPNSTLNCGNGSSTTLYLLDGTGHAVYTKGVSTTTYSNSAVSNVLTFSGPAAGVILDALAISPGGAGVYATAQTATAGTPITVYYDNVATGAQSSLTGPTPLSSGTVVGGAVERNSNIYYLFEQVGTQVDVYGFSTLTNTPISGRIGRMTGASNLGDVAFDTLGDAYFVEDTTITFRTATSLPTTGVDSTVAYTQAFTGNALGTTAIGLAFDAAGYLSTLGANPVGNSAGSGVLDLITPNWAGAIVVHSFSGPGAVVYSDMASCDYGSTLTLQKNIVGRANSTDQFNLTISESNSTAATHIAAYHTGVTSGATLGVQSASTAIAGPYNYASQFNAAGIIISNMTIGETAASGSLSNYLITYSCADPVNGVAAGTPATLTTSGTILPDIPSTVTGAGESLVCTIFNTPKATVTISKVSVGGTGTFSFTGTNGYANTSITTTTVGTAKAGTSRSLTNQANGVTVSEAATNGFVLTSAICPALPAADYSSVINADGSGSLTILPAGTAPGGNIACTFTNTALVDLTITKTDNAITYLPGEPVSYTMVIGNSTGAGGAAVNSVFTDPAPANETFTAVSCPTTTGGATCPAAGSLTVGNLTSGIALPSIPKSGTVTLVVSGTVKTTATGAVTNTASVAPSASQSTFGTSCTGANGTFTAPTCSAVDTDTFVSPPFFIEGKTANLSSYIVGQAITYTLTITNTGKGAGTAELTDEVPAIVAVSAVTCGATTGSTCESGPQANSVVGRVSLPPGGLATYFVVGLVIAPGDLTDSMTVVGSGGCAQQCGGGTVRIGPPATVVATAGGLAYTGAPEFEQLGLGLTVLTFGGLLMLAWAAVRRRTAGQL